MCVLCVGGLSRLKAPLQRKSESLSFFTETDHSDPFVLVNPNEKGEGGQSALAKEFGLIKKTLGGGAI